MSRNIAKKAAAEIAAHVITAARNSGTDPIAWITGNSYVPPLRWLDAAERIWQGSPAADVTAWDALTWRLGLALEDADVALECPEHDNALYAVDLRRFEYVEDPDGERLQDDWQPITVTEQA